MFTGIHAAGAAIASRQGKYKHPTTGTSDKSYKTALALDILLGAGMAIVAGLAAGKVGVFSSSSALLTILPVVGVPAALFNAMIAGARYYNQTTLSKHTR